MTDHQQRGSSSEDSPGAPDPMGRHRAPSATGDAGRTPHGETPYSPTSLLRALTSNPLDFDELRGTSGVGAHEEEAPPDTTETRILTTVLAVALGLLVAIAVIDLRRDASAADSPRALLEAEVEESRQEIHELESRRETLEQEVLDLQGPVLDGADDGAADRLAAYERAGSGVALAGPGVVLELDDSAALPASSGVSSGTVNRVTDGDLQIAVNGLWAAGAEAVAVNGQRISSTSAIRTAGSAILVDFRPLSPPYRVTALGDPKALRENVESGEAGAYLADITSRFAIRVAWQSEDELTVPARAMGTLREANPLEPDRGPPPRPAAADPTSKETT